MKKYLASLLFLGTISMAHAGFIDMNGNVDVLSMCRASSGTCKLNENGVKINITCSKAMNYNTSGGITCGDSGVMNIESNIPMNSIVMESPGTLKADNSISTTTSSGSGAVNTKNAFSLTIRYEYGANYYANLRSIRLAYGVNNGITESLQAVDAILYAAYTNALTAANMFKGEIAKTHRNHMTRFIGTLQEGIQLLDPNNPTKVSIVDWRVQENARLITVFGTIMNELLTDYDDVERLKVAISTLSSLVDQLRVSYGWERGLAGNVSKASSALLQVVRLEIQELASIKMAMGDSNLTPYTNLLKTSGILLSKVNASKSGDMKAQREIYEFADAWNSTEFQAELNRLLNAGPDFKNLVLPKLVMLLKSIESINDLADANLVIPVEKKK